MGYANANAPEHLRLKTLYRGLRAFGALLLQTTASVAITAPAVHAFGKIALVTAKVYDSTTRAPVNDAIVIVATPAIDTTGVTCISGKLQDGITPGTPGECTLGVNAEITVSLEASKAPYQLKAVSITAADGSSLPVDFPLTGSILLPLRIGASYYADLAAAYAAATAGSTVQLKAQTFTGPFNFNRNIAVKLEGGYDANYGTTRTGYTELTGPVTISGTSSCQATIDRVVVR